MKLEKYWQTTFESQAGSLLSDHDAANWSKYSLDKRMNACVEYLMKYSTPDKSVLDAGSGPGTYLSVMTDLGFNVFGMDFSYKMAKRAHLNYGIRTVCVSSLYDIAAKNEMFDAVIVMGIFQYLTEQALAISELYRCLRKNGLVILNTLNKKMLIKTLKRKETKGKLIHSDPFILKAEFENAGFRNIEIIPFFLYTKPFRFLEKFDKKLSRFNSSMYFAHDFFFLAWK